MRLAGMRPRVDGADAHLGHESPHAFAVHSKARKSKLAGHAPAPVERGGQILLVNETHELLIGGGGLRGAVVEAGTGYVQQVALRAYAEPGVVGVDHALPPTAAQRPKALCKKSFSTVSSPILAWSSLISAA